jgi:ribose-phosphate pyrophosphokinase
MYIEGITLRARAATSGPFPVFKKVRYPDGQLTFALNEGYDYNGCGISARISSTEDLVALLQIKQVLDRKGLEPEYLFITCMLGQRSDRVFSENQSFDLKVYAQILNLAKFKSIYVLDPHSDVLCAMVENCYPVDFGFFVQQAYSTSGSGTFVSPDAGAYKKVFKIAQERKAPLVAANKYRNSSGDIELNISAPVEAQDCLIVDDYIDGGATFVALAERLKDQGARTVSLYVTHGLFSRGYEHLFGPLDHVFVTNSVKEVEPHPRITVYPVI